MSDEYQILGVTKTASIKEIRLAYLNLAKQCHPDLFPNNKQAEADFKRYSAAYDTICNLKKIDPLIKKDYTINEIIEAFFPSNQIPTQDELVSIFFPPNQIPTQDELVNIFFPWLK